MGCGDAKQPGGEAAVCKKSLVASGRGTLSLTKATCSWRWVSTNSSSPRNHLGMQMWPEYAALSLYPLSYYVWHVCECAWHVPLRIPRCKSMGITCGCVGVGLTFFVESSPGKWINKADSGCNLFNVELQNYTGWPSHLFHYFSITRGS